MQAIYTNTNKPIINQDSSLTDKPKGKFIVLESLDGAGKTLLVSKLKDTLDPKEWVFTREPGGTPLGELLRSILLTNNDLDNKTEILLQFAQRQQHIQDIILPALKAGKNVVCERYTDSTFAYQTYQDLDGSNYRLASILNEQLVRHICKPDLVLVLNLPLEVALARLDPTDRYELKPKAFFEHVYKNYQNRLANSDRYLAVDALQSPNKVLSDTLQLLNSLVKIK